MNNISDLASQIVTDSNSIISLIEEMKTKYPSMHPSMYMELDSAVASAMSCRTAASAILTQSQMPGLANVEMPQHDSYDVYNYNIYGDNQEMAMPPDQFAFGSDQPMFRPATPQMHDDYLDIDTSQGEPAFTDWSEEIIHGGNDVSTAIPTYPTVSQPMPDGMQPPFASPSTPSPYNTQFADEFTFAAPSPNVASAPADPFSTIDDLFEDEALPDDPFSMLNSDKNKADELPEEFYEDVSDLFDTAIGVDDDDEFKVASVPFAVDIICIEEDGMKSSMYADCLDENIGEWEADAILSESAFNVTEFSLEGPLDGGEICTVTWYGNEHVIVTHSPLSYKVGALTQASKARGLSREDIKTSFSDSEIIERTHAFSADEALSKLPLMDIDKIAISFEYKGVEYTMYMKTAVADIEFEWTQAPEITAPILADMLQFVSVSLDTYKVDKSDLESAPKEELLDDDATKSSYYHRYENSYNIMKVKHRVRNDELDINSFVVRDGKCTINRCSQSSR